MGFCGNGVGHGFVVGVEMGVVVDFETGRMQSLCDLIFDE